MRLSFYATSKPSPEYLARLKVAARSVYPRGVTLHPATDFTNADLVLDASDTDEEMNAMFEYNASLVPWPGHDHETLYFDIESHNAEKRWDMPVHKFVRTVQWAWGIDGETHFSTNVDDLYTEISKAWGLVAHNGHPFDFSVLLGDEALTWAREGRLFDTMVFGNLANPAPFTFTDRHGRQSWMEIGGVAKVVPHTRKWLSLDNQAYVLGVPGKFGSLEELARKHNPPKTKREDLDFGLIPVDDEDFVAYARQDIPALQGITFGLLKKKPLDDYDRREQLCAAINAQISRNGWLVDRDAAQQRVDEQALKRERILAGLSERYDFPTEGKSPWISAKGKAAILAALKDFGIVPTEHLDTWPFGKTGPSLAGSVLVEHCTEPEAAEFAQAIAELGGQRPLAGQALQFTHSDGRVHPDITSMQRSGRMSITQPSLGTWTARGDSSIEKRYFLADPGCVLLEYDMSNADARAVAAMSRDYEFAKRFEDGVDAHELTGRFMFGDELYDSDPDIYRFRAKTCIAEGERVLTDQGLVPIEAVTNTMRLWDGEGFVTHEGVIDQGEREVITYDGLTATRDHIVFAWSEGKIVEVPFGFAAAENLTLVTTERRGSGIRVRNRDFRYGKANTRQKGFLRTGPLPKLWSLRLGSLLQLATRFKLWVSDVRAACEKAVPKMVGAAYGRGSAAMSEPQQSRVSSLRWTGGWVWLVECGRSLALDLVQPWSVRPGSHAGPDRQQQGLRAGKFTVGHSEGATREPKKHRHFGVSSRALAFFCRNRLPLLTKWLHAGRDDRGRSGDSPNQGLSLSSSGGKTRVYDIYSAGPHNRFTVSGKLVHNCAHGFNYGLGAKKLAKQLRIDLDHAYKFVDFMHASYPHLIYWQGQVRDAARIGYVVNDWGRKMPVDEDRSYTQSPSLMGQSSTRELLFDGLIKLPDEILRMLKITVHDAVVFSFPEQRVDELSQVVVESFETEWNGIKFPLHRGPEAPDWHKAGH